MHSVGKITHIATNILLFIQYSLISVQAQQEIRFENLNGVFIRGQALVSICLLDRQNHIFGSDPRLKQLFINKWTGSSFKTGHF